MEIDESINVFGEPLETCGEDPMTGFFRDGSCNTCSQDVGSHTVCVELTREFLEFSKGRGNDLMTPIPAYGFPGLRAGQRWCLCATRWLEAQKKGKAPRVHLRRTHQRALETVPMEVLRPYAIDVN